MQLNDNQVFCDWITVSQKHEIRHSRVCAGVRITTDPDNGEVIQTSYLHHKHEGRLGSSIQIRSDGETVEFSGNPSKFNRSENYQGYSLDEAKSEVNRITESVGLPPFSGGKIDQLQSGGQQYTGAKISRLDMTANIKTGSAANRDIYLKHQQTQEIPRLMKLVFGSTTYYGRTSDSRTIRIYDKGSEMRENTLKHTKQREYIQKLIEWLNDNGIIRYETEYHRYLRDNDLRYWHRATHERLAQKTNEDIGRMTQQIKATDTEGMPKKLIATLSMYICGHNVKALLSPTTYYQHRKALKEYGYDISSTNIHMLNPKVQIITLEPAGVPDFYKHAPAIEA